MRREDLVKSIVNVLDALSASSLDGVLTQYTKELEKNASTAYSQRVLTALKEYTLRVHNIDSNGRKLLSIFGLEPFEDPKVWGVLSNGKLILEIVRYQVTVALAVKTLSELSNLLKPEEIRLVESSYPPYAQKAIISTIILETTGQPSKPERLTMVLESISILYDAFSRLYNLPHTPLAVLSCDSGSDKSFDFLGSAETIGHIKDFILSLWDKIVFHRESKTERNLSIFLQTIPAIEQVEKLKNEGTLEPETAERIKRQLLDGATKFLDSGSIIPEIEEPKHFNVRELMAPQPKFLAEVTLPDEEAGDLSE